MKPNKGKIIVRGQVWKQITFEKWETLDPERTAQFIPDGGFDEPTFWMNYGRMKKK